MVEDRRSATNAMGLVISPENAQAAAINAIVVVKVVILPETAPSPTPANADLLVLRASAIDATSPATWPAIAPMNERDVRCSRTYWTLFWSFCDQFSAGLLCVIDDHV